MSADLAKSGDDAMSLAIWTKQTLTQWSQRIAWSWQAFLRALDEPRPDESDLFDTVRDREERVFDIRKNR